MHSLFEVLKGQYSDGQALSTYNANDEVLRSVHDHLSRLLNARQGVLVHLPNYGLPDLDAMYQELPYSEHDIAQAVKTVIETYEPRFTKVKVVPRARDIRNCVVRLEISGQLVTGHHIRLQTMLKSNFEAYVGQINQVYGSD